MLASALNVSLGWGAKAGFGKFTPDGKILGLVIGAMAVDLCIVLHSLFEN
jgi:hypothetical protein